MHGRGQGPGAGGVRKVCGETLGGIDPALLVVVEHVVRLQLLHFLRDYFANDLDVTATAKQCALHPNTVRYRIKRIEEALHASLCSPAVITEIHLSLDNLVSAPTDAAPTQAGPATSTP